MPFFSDYPMADYKYNVIPVGKYTLVSEEFGYFIREDYSEVASIGRFCSLNKTMRVGGNHPQLVSTSAYLYDIIKRDTYRNSDEIKRRNRLIFL